jgi:hypothetical protein
MPAGAAKPPVFQPNPPPPPGLDRLPREIPAKMPRI